MQTKSEQAIKLSQALRTLQETFELRVELAKQAAIEAKVNYDALLAAGFTDNQAMQLLCAKERRA